MSRSSPTPYSERAHAPDAFETDAANTVPEPPQIQPTDLEGSRPAVSAAGELSDNNAEQPPELLQIPPATEKSEWDRDKKPSRSALRVQPDESSASTLSSARRATWAPGIADVELTSATKAWRAAIEDRGKPPIPCYDKDGELLCVKYRDVHSDGAVKTVLVSGPDWRRMAADWERTKTEPEHKKLVKVMRKVATREMEKESGSGSKRMQWILGVIWNEEKKAREDKRARNAERLREVQKRFGEGEEWPGPKKVQKRKGGESGADGEATAGEKGMTDRDDKAKKSRVKRRKVERGSGEHRRTAKETSVVAESAQGSIKTDRKRRRLQGEHGSEETKSADPGSDKKRKRPNVAATVAENA